LTQEVSEDVVEEDEEEDIFFWKGKWKTMIRRRLGKRKLFTELFKNSKSKQTEPQ
jgi:hypothetical protein